jgi:hypothetical protein
MTPLGGVKRIAGWKEGGAKLPHLPPATTEVTGFDLARARTHAGRANACERARGRTLANVQSRMLVHGIKLEVAKHGPSSLN